MKFPAASNQPQNQISNLQHFFPTLQHTAFLANTEKTIVSFFQNKECAMVAINATELPVKHLNRRRRDADARNET